MDLPIARRFWQISAKLLSCLRRAKRKHQDSSTLTTSNEAIMQTHMAELLKIKSRIVIDEARDFCTQSPLSDSKREKWMWIKD